jgi:hypothetical protein
MVRITSAVLGSALVGMSSAAGAGSKEQYASGEVHASIMKIKMVCAIHSGSRLASN